MLRVFGVFVWSATVAFGSVLVFTVFNTGGSVCADYL